MSLLKLFTTKAVRVLPSEWLNTVIGFKMWQMGFPVASGTACSALGWPRYSGKRNVTVCSVVRPSVCLSRRHTQRDSPGDSMRRGQRTFLARQ